MRVPSLESDAGGRPSVPPGSALPPPEEERPPDGARWVLQAEAAKYVGCSVSAIRKWRREGSVASRKITTPAGLERVEVRLDHVVRRAGPRDRAGSEPSMGTDVRLSVPGTVLVPINDFQTLLERVAMAEQLAEGLEARLRAIDAEASRMREQFVELRRQIEQERRREEPPAPPSRPAMPPPARAASPPPPPPTPATAPARPPAPEQPQALPEAVSGPSPDKEGTPGGPPPVRRPLPEARPGRAPERPPRPTGASFRQWLGGRKPPEPPEPPPVHVDHLGTELRRLYARLQARQGEAQVSPAEAERWVADLAAYDAALVRACRAVGVPTAYRVGERIPGGDRIALSRALAAAGVDVRLPLPTSP